MYVIFNSFLVNVKFNHSHSNPTKLWYLNKSIDSPCFSKDLIKIYSVLYTTKLNDDWRLQT